MERTIINIDKGPTAVVNSLLASGEEFEDKVNKTEIKNEEYSEWQHRPWEYLSQEDEYDDH